MKLNNKGFALTSIIYMLIVLFLMILLLILANLAQRKVVLDKIKNDVKINLNQGGQLAKNTYIVTFDPQGGEITQTTKQVTYNETYGELPTPTREAYVFKGWRGKNLFNKNAVPETDGNYITSNGGNTSYGAYAIYKARVKPNTQYTITNSGKSTAPGYALYDENYNFITGAGYSNTANVTFTTPANASYIRFSVVANLTQGDEYRYDKDYFQLEEGNTATSYEPYQEYTSNTIVTKQENHTLYAIWKKEYTITNLVQNGSFENGFDNWERTAYTDNTLDYHSINSDYKKDGSNSMARIANSTAGRYYITQYHIPFISGHKYYFFAYGYTNSNTSQQINGDVANRSNSSIVASFVNSDGWKKISRIYTPENTEERQISINYGTTTDTTYVDGIGMIDLTEAFGEGNEPDKSWCDDNIEYFDGTTTILY